MKKIYLTLLVVLAFITLKASPDIYKPELVSPANSATAIAVNALLDWNAVTGEIGLHYEINLSKDADFTNPAVFTTDLTSYQTSELLFGQQYYWRVRAIDNSGMSEWSDVFDFTTISTVTVRRPTDGANNVTPNVQIMWQEMSGIAFFDYQLDTTENFNSSMMSIHSVSSSVGGSTNASSLIFGQKYYLRMRARHSADTSVWSPSRNFTVLNAITLKNPANGANEISPDATFEWTKIDGLLKYNIYLSTDPAMSTYEVYSVAPNLGKLTPDTLMFGTKYYWQLAAIHAADTLLSEVRNFTTIDKVTLSYPANNATNIELQPVLQWTTMTGIITFQLELASNASFTNSKLYNVDDGGTNVFEVPINVLDSASVYYWRVRAISSRDTSNFSDAFSFRCVALGMNDATVLSNGIRVYPSPANSKISIQIKNTYSGKATIEIFDLLGNKRMVSTTSFINGFVKDFYVGNLSNGIYMMSVVFDGQRNASKLIIQH